MKNTNIKISSIIENQVPEFIKVEYPLFVEFLKEYYRSTESNIGPSDILENIDQYVKVDELSNLADDLYLYSDINQVQNEIIIYSLTDNIKGVPNSYGLVMIDNEIILYKELSYNSEKVTVKGKQYNKIVLSNCVRGFSGITAIENTNKPDQLVFSDTEASSHKALNQGPKGFEDNQVFNLSVLFLKKFLKKIKTQVLPGFEERELYSDLNESLFIKQSKDFYSSKGTDSSFKILFKALYGKNVDVIKPREFLIQPSDAQYRVVKTMIVEAIEGDPLLLLNRTLYQDNFGFINSARGTVSAVEKIFRSGREYYRINIDDGYERDINFRGTLFSSFSIHPKTICTNKVIYDQFNVPTVLDVDSTIGFPNSGTLIIKTTNIVTNITTELTITYKSKSTTQFYDCEGINQDINDGSIIYSDAYAYGYENIDNQTKIKIRITGVLSDFSIPDQTYLFEKGNPIRVKTLGFDSLEPRDNNWFYNIPLTYTITSAVDEILNNSYTINLYDEHAFVIGDRIVIDELQVEGDVFKIKSKKSISVQLDRRIDSSQIENFTISKKLLKANLRNYPELNIYSTNVQNTYLDKDNSLYVTSSSIPSYLNTELDISDLSVVGKFVFGKQANITNTIAPDKLLPDGSIDYSYFCMYLVNQNGVVENVVKHNFYTGDAVIFRSLEPEKSPIPDGVYYIKDFKPSDLFGLKLAKSRSNILNEKYVSTSSDITECLCTLQFFSFSNTDINNVNNYLLPQKLDSHRIIRKLEKPKNTSLNYKTTPGGFNGIFLNGVEILNYKDKNSIYYGPIEKIEVTSPGYGYDIINAPKIILEDVSGTGAVVYPSINGGLEKINIIDPGFDFLEPPKIIINGGNGYGAKAEVILSSFEYSTTFNPSSTARLLDLSSSTIGFSTFHGFRNYEEVIYNTGVASSLPGLSNGSSYYVSVVDSTKIKLHNSYQESISGINTVSITSYGTGKHILKSAKNKKRIGSINIVDSGKNYQTKKTSASYLQIDTTTNVISIKSHGYENGEIIVYNLDPEDQTTQPITGLNLNESYYVTKLNDDQFKLSKIGIGTDLKDFYYKTKQYVNLGSVGLGTHFFNYEPITVTLESRIGVNQIQNENYNATLQPIFRGGIQSIFIEKGGSSYGNEEILNYVREPNVLVEKGYNAEAVAICDAQGSLIEIIVINSGINYTSIPDIVIQSPTGTGAVATPVIQDGKIVEIKLIYGGINYNQNTTLVKIISRGEGLKVETRIKEWTINLPFRYSTVDEIKNSKDEGVVVNGLNKNYGLQYCHYHLPYILRESVYSEINGKIYTDSENDNGSPKHSPIVGWAYDGNPIYGPYGYVNGINGRIDKMKSGYTPINFSRSNGPSDFRYPLGFFINDYEYEGNGDLDESNGRFCITPEFPNGTYAYFCTVENKLNSPVPVPVFPYVIGDVFKSQPIDFNFSQYSNQNDIDINQTGWIRNTHPYNLNEANSKYNYIINPDKIRTQSSKIKFASYGEIDSVDIINGGLNYKVNDKIIFKNDSEFGLDGSANVSIIGGKEVVNISYATSSFSNVEFERINGSDYIFGYTDIPHNYNNNDLISIVAPIERVSYKNVKINTNVLIITKNVEPIDLITPDYITYINVSGNLSYLNIREDDFYKVDNEIVKILNIDPVNSRIKVLREELDTSGSGFVTHYSGSLLRELPRKFAVNLGIATYYNLKTNYNYYFNPKESLALGTTAGPGIVSSFTISNPGVGKTLIVAPTQTIYLPNHGFNTGDELTYYTNGGSGFTISTNGTNNLVLSDDQPVYAIKVNNDLIGISTTKVGVGTTGVIVKYGTNDPALVYFKLTGTGLNHSFRTNYRSVLTCNISKTRATVSTGSTHGLSNKDNIEIKVLPNVQKNIKVKYSDTFRVLLIDPKTFEQSDVDIVYNTIKINNHQYKTGDKILYNSDSPMTGLSDDNVYYVVVIDSNKICLCRSYYETTKEFPEFINLSNPSRGTLSSINPEIKVIKNQQVIFDLSDQSLSYSVGNSASRSSSFYFDLYLDQGFRHKYYSNGIDSSFDIIKSGTIGVTSDAKLTLSLRENTPSNLYYKLTPVKDLNNPAEKRNITIDIEQQNNNKITCVNSLYDGKYEIYDVTPTTFKYILKSIPEKTSYNFLQAKVTYETSSLTALGPISKVKIQNKGKYFKKLPSETIIKTKFGTSGSVFAATKNIGSIKNIELEDIGFDYPSDLSISPSVKLPTILKLEPLYSFDYIKIISGGTNYLSAPNLVVIDSKTKNVIDTVTLGYTLGDDYVSIIRNTKDLSNVIPRIVPVDNTNGIKISDATFLQSNTFTSIESGLTYNSIPTVTIFLDPQYSFIEDFPFDIGDFVFIENIAVLDNGKGYNSKSYNYAYFEVIDRDAQLGGGGANITLNWSNYYDPETMSPDDFVYEEEFSGSARVIPIKYFPVYEVKLKKNNFTEKEIVSTETESSYGIVESWDTSNDYLKVGSKKPFRKGITIIGQTSKTKGIVANILEFDCEYKVNSTSIVNQGWKNETGFLNSSFQRLHDSDYYQYFSYALRSEIPYDKWNDPVSSLNHTAGFKKFSDLIVESEDKNNSGITTSQNNGGVFPVSDIIGEVSVNCYYDFDLATETTIEIDSEIKSDEVVFNSRILADYIESVSNRVLSLDDISKNFNSIPREAPYSIVNRTDSTKLRSKKYFFFIQDRRFSNDRQMIIVTSMHDSQNVYLTQYGRVETKYDLGSFEGQIIGTQWNLLYYPIYSEVNNYILDYVSFDMSDDIDIATIPLGDSCFVSNQYTTVPFDTLAGESVPVVGIASTYRASKTLIQVSTSDLQYFEYNELSMFHDDNGKVTYVDYGELTSANLKPIHEVGLGTYWAHMNNDGSAMIIDFIPNQNLTQDINVKTINVSIANTNYSTTDFLGFDTGEVRSITTKIEASPTPEPSIVTLYDSQYKCLHGFFTLEDAINKEYKVTEINVINDDTNSYMTEYAMIETNPAVGLGTFGTRLIAGETRLLFTPNPDTEVYIKGFQLAIGRF